MKKNSSNSLIGISIFTAVSSSLCCIIPVIALFAGSSSIISNVSWIEPVRPYLVYFSIVVIAFAWYQNLKQKKEKDCCSSDKKPKFLNSKLFLVVVTVFSALMITFPYYSIVFFPKTEKQFTVVEKSNIQTVEFNIAGMTCNSCEEHIKHAVNKLNGVIKADASYEKASAEIQFDNSKINIAEIEKTINSTGYKITNSSIKKL